MAILFILADDGLIRVGGRIRRANIPLELKHFVLLHGKEHLTQVRVRYYNQKTCNSGITSTLSEIIRASGYWILQARSQITACIWKCVPCRRTRGSYAHQKMSDLPEDRIAEAPPFS